MDISEYRNYLCPLTGKIFFQPYFCSDGYTYEKSAILQWKSIDSYSPYSRGAIINELYPNLQCHNQVDAILAIHPQLKQFQFKIGDEFQFEFETHANEIMKRLELCEYGILFYYKNIPLKKIVPFLPELLKDEKLSCHLVKKVLNIHSLLNDGWRFIHYICKYGTFPTLKLCFEKGARLDVETEEGLTPIFIALHRRFYQMIEYLIQSGASIEKRDLNNKTLLHHACKYSDKSIVSLLLDHEVELDATDRKNKRAIHYLCKYGNIELFELFMDRYHTNRELYDKIGFESETIKKWRPIHYVCKFNQRLLNSILKLELNLEAKTRKYQRAIHLLSKHSSYEMIKLLVDRRVYLNPETKKSWRPVHYLAKYGEEKTIFYLINNGADVFHRTKEGYHLVHLACKYDKKDLIQYLVDYGVDIESKDNFGNRAIQYAIQSGNDRIVSFLLSRNVELSWMERLNYMMRSIKNFMN